MAGPRTLAIGPAAGRAARRAPPACPPSPPANQNARLFDAIVAAIEEHRAAYRAAIRLEGGTIGPAEPRGIAAAIAARLFERRESDFYNLGEVFASRAAREAALPALSCVVASLVALRLGAFERAGELAERAMASDQHDLFAQRLYLAAGERSVDLELGVDRWLARRTCANPFREIETRVGGDVHTCCSAWMPVPIGNINDAEPFWTSPRAAEVRRSVHDGDFSHCSRISCPHIADRTLPPRPAEAPETPPAPRRVILSHDRSCNLSCPSCRTETIIEAVPVTEAFDRIYDETLAPLCRAADEVKITGSGDPFGARHFRHVLKSLAADPARRGRILLHTNGVLADARAWDELGLDGAVKGALVSLDAAEPETYAELRRGGDFARLLDNLAFLGALVRSGRMETLRLDFTVQARNFREMPAFVDLARRVGASGVYFLLLRNWGTYSEEAYRSAHIGAPSHPDYDEFLDVLRDPRLAPPYVWLGTLRAHRERALGRGASVCVAGSAAG